MLTGLVEGTPTMASTITRSTPIMALTLVMLRRRLSLRLSLRCKMLLASNDQHGR